MQPKEFQDHSEGMPADIVVEVVELQTRINKIKSVFCDNIVEHVETISRLCNERGLVEKSKGNVDRRITDVFVTQSQIPELTESERITPGGRKFIRILHRFCFDESSTNDPVSKSALELAIPEPLIIRDQFNHLDLSRDELLVPDRWFDRLHIGDDVVIIRMELRNTESLMIFNLYSAPLLEHSFLGAYVAYNHREPLKAFNFQKAFESVQDLDLLSAFVAIAAKLRENIA